VLANSERDENKAERKRKSRKKLKISHLIVVNYEQANAEQEEKNSPGRNRAASNKFEEEDSQWLQGRNII
jgi:hypothetical protein